MASSQDIDIRNGKNRLFTHVFLIIFFQSVFFGSCFIVNYAIFTLNWKLCLFLATVSFLQRFLKRSQLFIDMINKYVKPLQYYRSWKRIQQQQIPEQQCTLFCLHPHSVLCYCIASNMNADSSKNSRMVGLASRFILAMPFIGAQLRLWGVQSVHAGSMNKLMKQKQNIAILPGGFEQATLTSPNQLRIFIKNRKGFIKFALKYNYTIRPILTYNEHKAYWTFDYLKKLRLFLNKLKLPGVLFGGGFLWLYFPLNIDIINIVGKGITRKADKIGQPVSNEQVEEAHKQYMNELQRINEKYREEYGQTAIAFY